MNARVLVKRAAQLLAACICLHAPSAMADLTVNGSFENGFTDWTTTCNVAIESAAPYSPTDGTKLVAFNAENSTPDGSVSQTVEDIGGRWYRLSFDVGNLSFNSHPLSMQVQVSEIADGVTYFPLQETINVPSHGGGITNWIPKKYIFTSRTHPFTLSFSDVSQFTDSLDLVLDHVRLARSCSLDVNSSLDSLGPGIAISGSPADLTGKHFTATHDALWYFEGTVVSFAAPASAAGRTFIEWQKDGVHFSDNPSTSLTMTADTNLRAIYENVLILSPDEPFEPHGVPGYIYYNPITKTYHLTNTASWPVDWTASATIPNEETPPWMEVVPAGGTLQPRASVNLYVGTTADGYHLPPGDYSAQLLIQSQTGDLERDATLTNNVIVNGSFELGLQGWQVEPGPADVAVQSQPPYVPVTGAKILSFGAMDTPNGGTISQTFPTLPGRVHLLYFTAGNLAYTNSPQMLQTLVDDGTNRLVNGLMTIPAQALNGQTTWQAGSYKFTPTGSSAKLTFIDASTATNAVDLVLDSVKIDIARLLTVTSYNNDNTELSGVPIECPQLDLDGDNNGNAPMTRQYAPGTPVTLTAPATVNGMFFKEWLVTNVGPGYQETSHESNLQVTLTMNDDSYANAYYNPSVEVLPDNKINFKGETGRGFFVPDKASYTIINHSDTSQNWTASLESTDAPPIPLSLAVSAENGSLAPDESTALTVSPTGNAQNLLPGIYHENLIVNVGGTEIERAVTLTILPSFTVTTLADENDPAPGMGSGESLREIIGRVNLLNTESVIRFAPELNGGTILLGGTQLSITANLDINASDLATGITVSAVHASRIFDCGNASFDNLMLIDGDASGGEDGGAIRISGFGILNHCSLTDNQADDGGGGIFVNIGGVTLDHCTVARNHADYGGGIGGFWASIQISGCDLSGNSSESGGGAIGNSGSLSIENSSITENHTGGNGGAVSAYPISYKLGGFDLTNSTIANNHADGPGGAIALYTTGNVVQSTITKNTAGQSGGGIYAYDVYQRLTMNNSILTANESPLPTDISGIHFDNTGHNFIGGDPKLAPLANYGGDTLSMPPLPGSPVIDAGVLLGNTPSSDQLGHPRPTGPLPDIGAVEAFPFSSLPLIDSDHDGIDDRLEPAYGLTVGINDNSKDSDGDGSTDAQEIANMTNPFDANSSLKITSFHELPATPEQIATANRTFHVEFTSFPGLSYSLQCDQNLDFSGSEARTIPLGNATDFTDSADAVLSGDHNFVRIRRDP